MGEIDDVQHAIDQRQRDRHQRVDRAGQQAVDDGGDEISGANIVVRYRFGRRGFASRRVWRARRLG